MQKDKTISLKMAIDAVHKNYDTILDFTSDGKTIANSIEDILSELPSATDTNVATTDTISRNAALDVLHGYFDGMLETDTVCPKDLYNEIEALPPAQPWKEKGMNRWTTVGEAVAYEKGYTEGRADANQQQWIPCTPETMPEKEGRYVCTYTYDGKKDVFMFRFEDGDFLVPWYVDTITAWYKPLDPWEGGSHE